MTFTLPALPYAQDALSPHISEQTLSFHYGKHHQGYVNKLNKATEGKALGEASLEDVIRECAGDTDQAGIFNNAAQVWNHTFYWRSMKPGGGGKPTGDVAKMIDSEFGGYEGFREAFEKVGASQFGSGWAWLVAKSGKLEVRKTANADLPLVENGVIPLLTMDVWEHAYYLDYQNRRPDYITSFLDNLVNWEFANENLAAR